MEKDFNLILRKANQEQKNLHTIEYETLGFSHTDIGKMLTEHWGFPQELSIAMESHHNPDEVPHEFSKFASTLYIADYICQERDIGFRDASSGDSDLFQRCLKRLDIKGYALDLIVNDMEKEIAMMEDHGLF